MKTLIRDTLFLRLFLLMFFALTLSHFIGRELFSSIGAGHQVPDNHQHPFWTVGFLVRLGAIALTAWIAARWLAKPIQRMAQSAYELGKNLDTPPIDESIGPMEVRQASTVFNQMQLRLKKQLEERNRFLAAVSHDLRTPLTRLKLRTEKVDQQELKSNIQSDINEMVTMVDAALDYLRNNEQTEAMRLLDVGALVNSLAEDAKECGDVVTVLGNTGPIKLQPLAMRRCLNNLIENAVRYGENADIHIGETEGEVVIAIHDSGPGIPEDKLEAVLDPFFRLEVSRNRHTGGVGLGLSIANDIAKKHGGSLTLKNAPEGGLIATVSLPIRR